jgi:hypothetical protein
MVSDTNGDHIDDKLLHQEEKNIFSNWNNQRKHRQQILKLLLLDVLNSKIGD